MYQPFDPPEPIRSKPQNLWTSAEAKAYLRWAIANLVPRTDALLNYLRLWDREPDAELREGQIAVSRIITEAGSYRLWDDPLHLGEYHRTLELEGISLASDLGLLLARRLTERFPTELQWAVGRKPKVSVSYGMPVLIDKVSREFVSEFSPITYAVSMCNASISNVKHQGALANVYDHICSRIVTYL